MRHTPRAAALALGVLLSAAVLSVAARADLGARPPRGAVVLFAGKDTSAWIHRGSSAPCQWTVTPDGALEVKAGAPDILTKQEFGDYHLHVEFRVPYMPDAHDQARGNSGVYNHGRYEIQVLDSLNNPTYKAGGCGSIYGQKDPDKNMAKPPLEWQYYDITFRAPRFDASNRMIARPRITVVWNGEIVHNDVEITLDNTTSGLGGSVPKTGPILLQNHGNPVRYRNIWIVPLKNADTAAVQLPHAGAAPAPNSRWEEILK